MKVSLLSVGSKMPSWVQEGTAEYQKRIKVDLGFTLTEVPLPKRSKSQNTEQYVHKEGAALLAKVAADDFVVALEVGGTMLSTEALARRLDSFRNEGRNLSLLIGGPDGLSDDCRARANECWSLSRLTLPHPLVRILVTEQLYRAMSILKGHPYHRD